VASGDCGTLALALAQYGWGLVVLVAFWDFFLTIGCVRPPPPSPYISSMVVYFEFKKFIKKYFQWISNPA
jgi:hypothetical protein